MVGARSRRNLACARVATSAGHCGQILRGHARGDVLVGITRTHKSPEPEASDPFDHAEAHMIVARLKPSNWAATVGRAENRSGSSGGIKTSGRAREHGVAPRGSLCRDDVHGRRRDSTSSWPSASNFVAVVIRQLACTTQEICSILRSFRGEGDAVVLEPTARCERGPHLLLAALADDELRREIRPFIERFCPLRNS
jgi:hypothetical protein